MANLNDNRTPQQIVAEHRPLIMDLLKYGDLSDFNAFNTKLMEGIGDQDEYTKLSGVIKADPPTLKQFVTMFEAGRKPGVRESIKSSEITAEEMLPGLVQSFRDTDGGVLTSMKNKQEALVTRRQSAPREEQLRIDQELSKLKGQLSFLRAYSIVQNPLSYDPGTEDLSETTWASLEKSPDILRQVDRIRGPKLRATKIREAAASRPGISMIFPNAVEEMKRNDEAKSSSSALAPETSAEQPSSSSQGTTADLAQVQSVAPDSLKPLNNLSKEESNKVINVALAGLVDALNLPGSIFSAVRTLAQRSGDMEAYNNLDKWEAIKGSMSLTAEERDIGDALLLEAGTYINPLGWGLKKASQGVGIVGKGLIKKGVEATGTAEKLGLAGSAVEGARNVRQMEERAKRIEQALQNALHPVEGKAGIKGTLKATGIRRVAAPLNLYEAGKTPWSFVDKVVLHSPASKGFQEAIGHNAFNDIPRAMFASFSEQEQNPELEWFARLGANVIEGYFRAFKYIPAARKAASRGVIQQAWNVPEEELDKVVSIWQSNKGVPTTVDVANDGKPIIEFLTELKNMTGEQIRMIMKPFNVDKTEFIEGLRAAAPKVMEGSPHSADISKTYMDLVDEVAGSLGVMQKVTKTVENGGLQYQAWQQLSKDEMATAGLKTDVPLENIWKTKSDLKKTAYKGNRGMEGLETEATKEAKALLARELDAKIETALATPAKVSEGTTIVRGGTPMRNVGTGEVVSVPIVTDIPERFASLPDGPAIYKDLNEAYGSVKDLETRLLPSKEARLTLNDEKQSEAALVALEKQLRGEYKDVLVRGRPIADELEATRQAVEQATARATKGLNEMMTGFTEDVSKAMSESPLFKPEMVLKTLSDMSDAGGGIFKDEFVEMGRNYAEAFSRLHPKFMEYLRTSRNVGPKGGKATVDPLGDFATVELPNGTKEIANVPPRVHQTLLRQQLLKEMDKTIEKMTVKVKQLSSAAKTAQDKVDVISAQLILQKMREAEASMLGQQKQNISTLLDVIMAGGRGMSKLPVKGLEASAKAGLRTSTKIGYEQPYQKVGTLSDLEPDWFEAQRNFSVQGVDPAMLNEVMAKFRSKRGSIADFNKLTPAAFVEYKEWKNSKKVPTSAEGQKLVTLLSEPAQALGMDEIKAKDGVDVNTLHPSLKGAASAVQNVLKGMSLPLVLTSTTDSTKHKTGSKHYIGKAFDIRTNDWPSGIDKESVAADLQKRLGDLYYVQFEPGAEEHIHIQARGN